MPKAQQSVNPHLTYKHTFKGVEGVGDAQLRCLERRLNEHLEHGVHCVCDLHVCRQQVV